MSKFQDFYNQLEEGKDKDLSAEKLLSIANELKSIANKLSVISTKFNPIQVNPTQRQYLNQFIASCNNISNFLVNYGKIV